MHTSACIRKVARNKREGRTGLAAADPHPTELRSARAAIVGVRRRRLLGGARRAHLLAAVLGQACAQSGGPRAALPPHRASNGQQQDHQEGQQHQGCRDCAGHLHAGAQHEQGAGGEEEQDAALEELAVDVRGDEVAQGDAQEASDHQGAVHPPALRPDVFVCEQECALDDGGDQPEDGAGGSVLSRIDREEHQQDHHGRAGDAEEPAQEPGEGGSQRNEADCGPTAWLNVKAWPATRSCSPAARSHTLQDLA
mmetsp:Transcript_95892/g.254738  ORF Transcript_95892/g.254738 Transcript_95892/m.254738 type:complete len:253 (+) Transcript_95892:3-761(+)